MRKIVLVLLLVVASLHAIEIDEYKVDLYYANGIMMQEDEKQARKDWQRRVKQLLQNYPNFQKRVGKIDVSYNLSDGMVADMWESFLQEVDLHPHYSMAWSGFKEILSRIPQTRWTEYIDAVAEAANVMVHDATLNEQVKKYKESIRAGHGVVVVAHSQGNLFTHEAYDRLVSESSHGWMGRYFHTIAVATPDSTIVNGGHGVTFDKV